MSTGNFITQENFDDYCFFPDSSDYNEQRFEYEIAEEEAKNILDEYFLQFFNIKLVSGYYDGIQAIIESKNEYLTADDICAGDFSNEDSKYFWNDCRSVTLRKIKSEIRRINKEILPRLRDYGFKKFGRVCRFSNGECVYTYL